MSTPRLSQVDNLKIVLVAWVIGGHALLGYSTVGGWAYDEVKETAFAPQTELVLAALLGPSGLFVIGVFFFLAGLFTQASLARKGARRFSRERVIRLGVPWVVSALLVWPLTMWIAYLAAGYRVSPWWVVTNRDPLLDSGSLWFALVLLLFSLGYAVVAGRRRPSDDDGGGGAAPGGGFLVAVAGCLVLVTVLVRLWFPAKSGQIFDLHLWQWPQCLAMFFLGIVGARVGWVRGIPDRLRRGSAVVTVCTLVLIPVLALAMGIDNVAADIDPFLGGWSWQALATAIVESVLVVAGSVWLLGLAQRRLTHTGPVATACASGAFVAFAVQGPVLIGLAVLLRPVAVPVEAKAVLVAIGAIVGCFWLGWKVVSRPRPGTAARRH